ncbi:MAG: C1 family peptidase [Calditrichia bacterium]
MSAFKTSIGLILVVLFFAGSLALAQAPVKDKAHFMEKKNEFWDKIKASVDSFNTKPKEPRRAFLMDFEGKEYPTDRSLYTTFWHQPPISQGWSGMCWCFATTSYFESEIKRLHNKEIKISELHTVYWEYVEKARRFIRERGESEFGEGSECNAVPRIWKKYGVVPAEVYTGLKPGQKFHDHHIMFKEMKSFLNHIKESNNWNEEAAISTIRSILNHYIGEPPAEFKYQGKTYTPLSFFKKVVNLNMDDYVTLMSLMEKPYWEQVEYDVPDNWWNSDEYYNVPLDTFMLAIKMALDKKMTIAIGGDVSEPGYESHAEVGVVPTFDIPSEYIDQYSRQFRFSNHTTTDDHAIHLVGYLEKDGETWYLIKDSGSGARNGKNPGYYFYHQDYIKLKIMNLFLHKSAIEPILAKFKK